MSTSEEHPPLTPFTEPRNITRPRTLKVPAHLCKYVAPLSVSVSFQVLVSVSVFMSLSACLSMSTCLPVSLWLSQISLCTCISVSVYLSPYLCLCLSLSLPLSLSPPPPSLSFFLCLSLTLSSISFIQAISLAPPKSTTTQRRSRHSTDTVPEFHAEAP